MRLPTVTNQTVDNHVLQLANRESYEVWYEECLERLDREQPALMEIVRAHANGSGEAAGRVIMTVIDLLETEYQKHLLVPSKN